MSNARITRGGFAFPNKHDVHVRQSVLPEGRKDGGSSSFVERVMCTCKERRDETRREGGVTTVCDADPARGLCCLNTAGEGTPERVCGAPDHQPVEQVDREPTGWGSSQIGDYYHYDCSKKIRSTCTSIACPCVDSTRFRLGFAACGSYGVCLKFDSRIFFGDVFLCLCSINLLDRVAARTVHQTLTVAGISAGL